MDTILSAQHLAFRRGRQTILRDASLELRAREVVALIGGNGAGKTTLLEILTGALSPDSGSVHYHDKLPRFWLGYLPDKAPLYPQWRGGGFLDFEAKTAHHFRRGRAVRRAAASQTAPYPRFWLKTRLVPFSSPPIRSP